MDHQTTVLEVGGLHWATSAASVERALSRRPGVIAVDANAAAQTASVTFDPRRTSVPQLTDWVRECGYHCRGESVPAHVCEPMSSAGSAPEAVTGPRSDHHHPAAHGA